MLFGGKKMEILATGIDVSYAQGKVDWKKMKDGGVEFAMLRAGYGKTASQKDAQFEANYAGCKANGVPCGAYW
jgi:GH25 family lysozyme M1 (1,4-beta-N-acetylmuramidase)